MERANDVLFDGTEIFQLAGDRVKKKPCTARDVPLASAFTAQLAAGRSLFEAATLAKAYVTKAIEKGYPSAKAASHSIISIASASNPPRAHPRSPPARHAPRRRTHAH